MSELKLGKMSSKEIAAWFNIKPTTYSHNIALYLDKLDNYCDFEKIYGGVIIKEIYEPVYDKNTNFSDEQICTEEIKRCVTEQNGLATIIGMANKAIKEGKMTNQRTARRRISKAATSLFGSAKELTSEGKIGTREQVWGIKLDNYNHYRDFTEEERKRFDDILVSFYTSEPEKIKKEALLVEQLRSKELDTDEFFEQKDRLGLNSFYDCIHQFYLETGNIISRCSKYEIIETIGNSKDFQQIISNPQPGEFTF